MESPLPPLIVKQQSLSDLVFEDLDRLGARTAVVDAESGRHYTLNDIAAASERLSASLLGHLRPPEVTDDVLLLCLPNGLPLVITLLAGLRAGAIVSPADPNYTSDELKQRITDALPRIVVCSASVAKKLLLIARTEETTIEVIYVSDPAKESLHNDAGIRVLNFRDVVYGGRRESSKVAMRRICPKTDIALLPYSSGTTGLPKGVMLTHQNITAMIRLQESGFYLVPSLGDRVLLTLPLFHGFGITVLLASLRRGAVLVILPGYTPDLFLSSIAKYKINYLPIVPALIQYLCTDQHCHQFDLSSVQVVTFGAAPITRATVERFRSVYPNIILLQGYGMTEGSILSHLSMPYSPAGAEAKDPVDQIMSVGPPLSTLECKVVDTATDEVLGENQTGEICIRGDTVMRGYWGKPEETAKTIDQEGFLHTGDIGYYDDTMSFYIVDRLKELIKVKGYQVSPTELENILLKHGAVRDVGVVGVADTETGERVVAFVVVAGGVTQQELLDHLNAKVVKYKRLNGVDSVIFTSSIPRNAAGKILRRQLLLTADARRSKL